MTKMKLICMSFIVLALQLFPPPPPSGNRDIHAGYSNNNDDIGNTSTFVNYGNPFFNFFGNLFNNGWNQTALVNALNGTQALPGGWIGYESIFGAIQDNFLIAITQGEWNAFINWAADNGKDVSAACNLATSKGSSTGTTNANCIEAPIPETLNTILVLSFFMFYIGTLLKKLIALVFRFL